MRAAGCQGPGRGDGGPGRRGPRGTAGHLPPLWHAAGRAHLLRRGQLQHSLDATFAARHPRPGIAGLALQSGGVGVVLLEHLSRLGVGVSSFVSLGDKDDVAGNDMLLWWASDEATKLAVLYLASIANPRKFARTARTVGRSHADPDRQRGPVRGGQRLAWPAPRPAPGNCSRRGGGQPAAHQAGPVRAGRR